MSDLFNDDLADLPVLHRSELERYVTCPRQARYHDTGAFGMPNSFTDTGSEAHDALSEATAWYFRNFATTGNRAELQAELLRACRETSPDTQPDVLKAIRPMAWAWASWITRLRPGQVMRYDGGEGEQSGQLAADVQIGRETFRYTSEIDLLYVTESSEVTAEVDYKTGWKRWTEADVRESFQFQSHAWLVFQNYEDVLVHRIQVWCTRTNALTYTVEFTRERDAQDIETRVMMAVGQWYRWRNAEPDNAEARPTREKCGICPAATICEAGIDQDVRMLVSNPGKFLDDMLLLKARVDARRDLLARLVDATGRDVRSESGAGFGFNAPAPSRRPTKKLYVLGMDTDDE